VSRWRIPGVLPDKRGLVQIFGRSLSVTDIYGAAVYWSQQTGAHYIWSGEILDKYASLDYENGQLGYPTTYTTQNLGGFTDHFQNGVICDPPPYGVSFVLYGPIYMKYELLGFENGVLGLPITDVGAALNGGNYAHFQHGAIYLKAENSLPYMVQEPIYGKWKSMGWEHGCLGYPISDTKNVYGRFESMFEHGIIYMAGIDPIVY